MHIYPIERQQLDHCVTLFLRVFNSPPWSEAWPRTAATTRLTDLLHTPGFYGLLASNDKEVLGFAAGYVEQWDRARHFYLKEMGVVPHHQRQGIGTTLLQVLGTDLAAAGVGRIYLLTARASAAEAFYRQRGFYVSPKMIMMGKNLQE
jgi:GNAT superfamily N-acetyltransferase